MNMKKMLATAAVAVSTLLGSAAFAEPAYLIATISVTDWDAYLNKYSAVAIPAIINAGGEILVGDTEPMVVEGTYEHNWTIVVKFPSQEAAVGFYGSPEYQAVIPIRHGATNTATSVLLLAAQFVPTVE